MDILFGSVLLLLTLYTSTISYALRVYSRARLAERLSESQQRRWMPRLERFGTQLQATVSFVRLTCLIVTVSYFVAPYTNPPLDVRDIAAAIGIALAVVVFAAIGVANSLAIHAGESVLARSLGVVWAARVVLYPIERVFVFIDFVVRRLLAKRDVTDEEESERREQEILDAVSEGEAHGAFDEEQKEMIESVFELHDTTVSAIMTPRTDIVALPIDASPEQIRQTIVEAGHSRVPVYEGSLDNIVGVLYAKDLLRRRGADWNVRDLMRTVPFVPETKPLDELLRELRQGRVHIAIVVDEYGGTAGLVTIEDILEELVGEIDDEYDRETAPVLARVDDNTLEVDARVRVDEINEELDIEIPENGSYETIGGFVFTRLGRIPTAGDALDVDNV
ncbi:MAG: HlyC/CorC family transporter, partial [Planctomycetota bacterium]